MKKNGRITTKLGTIALLLSSLSLLTLSFQVCTALEASYERSFDGGVVRLEVSDRIIFSILVIGESGFLCNVPKTIEQDDNQYVISSSNQGVGYIQITWTNFDGCGIIDPGQTAVGIMNTFPPSFNIEEPFRLYYNLGIHGSDFFDVTPDPPTTTTSLNTTTSTPSGTTSAPTTTLFPPFCIIEQLYGEQAEETDLLRYVRDNILTQTDEGRELVRLYYQWSRMLAETLQEDETFREEVKAFIDEIIFLIKEGSGLPI
jgi:hypothetical protein